jgi:hypothetical protein
MVPQLPRRNPPSSSAEHEAVSRAAAASTPHPDAIRAELEREYRGEEALFRRNITHQLQAKELQERHSWEASFDEKRLAILRQFEDPTVNLQMQERVLRNLSEQDRPTTYSTANTQKAYAILLGQLASVGHRLAQLQAQQERELQANDALLQSKLGAVRQQTDDAISAAVASHRQDIENRIWQEIAAAEAATDDEYQDRLALFGRSFKNPLDLPLKPVHPPAMIVGLISPPSSDATEIAAARSREIADMEQRRMALARFIMADTQKWAEGACARLGWALDARPIAGVPDRTSRLVALVRQDFDPRVRASEP